MKRGVDPPDCPERIIILRRLYSCNLLIALIFKIYSKLIDERRTFYAQIGRSMKNGFETRLYSCNLLIMLFKIPLFQQQLVCLRQQLCLLL